MKRSEDLSLVRKLWSIFDRKDRRALVGIAGLLFVGAVLECFTIGMVLPLFAVMTSSSDSISAAVPGSIAEWLSTQTERRGFVMVFASLVLLVYAVKNAYLALVLVLQHRFASGRQAALSRSLLESYLTRDYTFHAGRNSADLARNVTHEVVNVFHSGVMPLLMVVSETMVAIVLFALLLWVDPQAALATVLLLGSGSYLLTRLLRRRIESLGQQHHQFAGSMVKWINQSLGAIKEVKVLGREGFFLNAYAANISGYVRTLHEYRAISELPRLVLEVLAVAGLLLVLTVVTYQKGDVQSAIPVVVIFGLAGVRLLPAMNRIVNALAALRYARAAIEVIAADLHPTVATHGQPLVEKSGLGAELTFERQIELRNVSYSYPAATSPALVDVTLMIPKNAVAAIVGPSGVGKTTLIDLLLGVLLPTRGVILVDEVDIHTNLPAWRRKIAYIAQPSYLIDDTVRRNVAFAMADEDIDERRVVAALAAAQAQEFVERLTEGVDTIIGERGARLSAGQRQRIGIARALYHDPEVLVMDEATSSLDAETEREIIRAMDALRGHKTILLIAHRPAVVRACSHVFFFNHGRFVETGSVGALLESSAEFRQTLLGDEGAA